jgi:hypothetical protein
MAFAEWTADGNLLLLEVTSRFNIQDRHVDLSHTPKPKAK